MRPTKFILSVLILSVLAGPFLGTGEALAAFVDINHNWAKDAILALDDDGLFADLWTETFNPSSSLTHEEAFTLFAQAFELSLEEREALESWLGDLLVSHPEGITRGEFAAALANLVALGEMVAVPKDFYPSFADVSYDYPGFLGVELLQRLGLLPTHMMGRFEPYRLLTRSEAAFLLAGARELEKIEGVIATVAEGGKGLTLTENEGENEHSFSLLGETLYVGPGTLTSKASSKDAELQEGQSITLLARKNQALLVQLEQVSNAQVLMNGLNQATKVLVDVLTPEQINALIAGDWEQLGEEVRYELYDQLVERGVSPWEADALLKQDWDNLQIMLQERLTLEAADYLQVAPELLHAALSRDWEKLLEYAQVELAQRLLTSEWLQGVTTNN